MKKQKLESLLSEQLSPLLDQLVTKSVGVTLPKLRDDISAKLIQTPLLGVRINTAVPFRLAKSEFRSDYFRKLLREQYGNVSAVAKIAEVDRRSIHRFVNQARMDIAKVRSEMLKPSYLKELEVNKLLFEAIKTFEGILHPQKIETLYADSDQMSREIVEQLPRELPTLNEADLEFERQYFETLRREEKTIAAVARRSGLRYETVYRKLKTLDLVKP